MVVELPNEPESEEEDQKCEERPAENMSAKCTSTPEMLATSYCIRCGSA